MIYNNNFKQTKVIGNDYKSDANLGFKQDVASVFESFTAKGINISTSLPDILGSEQQRAVFTDSLTESFASDHVFTDSKIANSPFYRDYGDRYQQLLDNSLDSIATESVMQGYAPIVAYAPFFLKKQWVSNIFKDIVMTKIPTSPIINTAFERRYIKSQDGTRHEMPDVFYKPDVMTTLLAESQGLAFDTAVETPLPAKNVDLLTAAYVPGLVLNEALRADMLTQDLAISQVWFEVPGVWVPVDMRTDATTHTFVPKPIKHEYDNAGVLTTVEDELFGAVDFMAGTISISSKFDRVTKVKISGKLANRWNNRDLGVERRVEQIQHTMPESGPRMNSAITIEEASTAMALQKIDIIVDNVDMMGRTLAEFEDFDIRTNLDNSFARQEAATYGPYGYAKLTTKGKFQTLPPTGFANNVTDWMKDSREFLERQIAALLEKLKSPDVVVVAACNPEIVRYFQNGIDWVFTDETQISGMKIDYNFGIMMSGGNRIHMISSHYIPKETGVMLIVIPLTKELQTFEYYKYNMVIDRGYRNPLTPLTPNVMATHRTLFFEVLPVQGRMEIEGTSFYSPETYVRP